MSAEVLKQVWNAVSLLSVGGVLGYLIRFGSTWLGEILRERRAKKAEQQKATTEFVHIADDFRRYWLTKFYEDENAEPSRDLHSAVDWSGDPFDSLLTNEVRPLHARLPDALRDEAFALEDRVKNAKGYIAGLADFAEHRIDTEAPIIVCEIAIAADALYSHTLREARIKRPSGLESVSHVRARLAHYEKAKADEEEAEKNSDFLKFVDDLPKKAEG